MKAVVGQAEAEAGLAREHRLVEWLAGLAFGDIPDQARAVARRCMVDTIGVAAAGTREEVFPVARQLAQLEGTSGSSTVWGTSQTLGPTTAALLNGTAAHALDYDDVAMSYLGHPSAVLVPTVLAVGEWLGSAGRESVTAFVAGFEAAARIGGAVMPSHYRRGYHSTATIGTFAAAAAAGTLLRLGPGRLHTALGIAASLASGLKRNFGTMMKPFHAGMAARNGILAAFLAREGFTAATPILTSEGGYFATAADEAYLDLLDRGLGQEFALLNPGVTFKPYPSCRLTHGGIDAALRIRSNTRPDEIATVRCRTQPIAAAVLRYHRPQTPLEGKFSMEYCVAAALVDGQVTLSHFRPERLDDPGLRRMADRVRFEVDPDLSRDGLGDSDAAWMDITLNDGRVLSEAVRHPLGSPQHPLADPELEAKFHDCIEGIWPRAVGDQIVSSIARIEDVANIRAFASLLRS